MKRYGMLPHPEGGYFVQWFATEEKVSTDLPARYAPGSSRHCCTAILYMCVAGGKSALHKINSSELWMFHSGDPLTVVELLPGAEGGGGEGGVRTTILGPDLGAGQTFVHDVPGGTFFGAHCVDDGKAGFSLVTCVVSPGFDYKDWQLLPSQELRALFPGAAAGAAIDKLGFQ